MGVGVKVIDCLDDFTNHKIVREVLFTLKTYGQKVKRSSGNSGVVLELTSPLVIRMVSESPFATYTTDLPLWSLFDACPVRKANVVQQIYELLWILAGRTDLSALFVINPRVLDWSDNLGSWRAGYGGRIMGQFPALKTVIEILRESPTSRQAVLPIYHPHDLYASRFHTTKDTPCTLFLHFQYAMAEDKAKRLVSAYTIRSNDVFWGLSHINLNLLRFLSLVVGYFTQNPEEYEMNYISFNTHIYERHFRKMEKYLEECPCSELLYTIEYPWWVFVLPYSSFDELVSEVRSALRTFEDNIMQLRCGDPPDFKTVLKEMGWVFTFLWPALYLMYVRYGIPFPLEKAIEDVMSVLGEETEKHSGDSSVERGSRLLYSVLSSFEETDLYAAMQHLLPSSKKE